MDDSDQTGFLGDSDQTGTLGGTLGDSRIEAHAGAESGVQADEAVVGLEREMALFIRRARSFSARLARELHPELEAPAYSLLIWLDDAGPARLTDMAAAFGVGKATLSRQLNLLEQLELVVRTPDPTDGRAQAITLTPSAKASLGEIRAARRVRFRDLLAGWPADDVGTLATLLGRLNDAVGEAPRTNLTGPQS